MSLRSALKALSASGMPEEVVNGIITYNDLNLSLFGNVVSVGAMYAVIGGVIALLLGVYVLINIFYKKEQSKKLST